MKQASFKIDKPDKPDKPDKTDKTDKVNEDENKFVTSKKPVKHVENIYYFKS